MSPFDRMLSLVYEMIFVCLGGLLALLAISGRYGVPSRSAIWVGAVMLLWGIRAATRPARGLGRWMAMARAASLILAGLLVMAATRLSFRYFPTLLFATGAVLALRGVAGAIYFALAPARAG